MTERNSFAEVIAHAWGDDHESRKDPFGKWGFTFTD